MGQHLYDVGQVEALIAQGKSLLLAGDESLLKRLPKGKWIGGTIPYFMSENGGLTDRQHIFVNELPPGLSCTGIRRYGEAEIERIYADIPDGAVGKGLAVRVGCHTDTLWHLASWQRFPEVSRVFPLSEAVTRLASPFGGLVYVIVPGDCALGTIDVTIEGAVRAPLFVYGQTDRSAWRDTNRFAAWRSLHVERMSG